MASSANGLSLSAGTEKPTVTGGREAGRVASPGGSGATGTPGCFRGVAAAGRAAGVVVPDAASAISVAGAGFEGSAAFVAAESAAGLPGLARSLLAAGGGSRAANDPGAIGCELSDSGEPKPAIAAGRRWAVLADAFEGGSAAACASPAFRVDRSAPGGTCSIAGAPRDPVVDRHGTDGYKHQER